MSTSRYLLAIVIIGLIARVTPLSAVTVEICKTQWCERYAAENRNACSELFASSPSCLSLVEEKLRECRASCGEYPVSEPDPPPNPPGLGGCGPDHSLCY